MPEYFKKFPKVNYNFKYKKKSGEIVNETLNLTNIQVKYTFSSELKSFGSFYAYKWAEEDRPDSFARFYYNSDSLFWLVLYGSEKYDAFNEFPKNEKSFYEYLYRKYKTDAIDANYNDSVESVLQYVNQTVYAYKDADGDTVDQTTYNNLPLPKSIQTLFEYEEEQNEKLRTLNIVDSRYSKQIKREFDDVLSQLIKDLEQ